MAFSLARGASFPGENERLVSASRLWVTVSFFHPYVASRKIDWDGAFFSTVPKIRTATTIEEYASALESMLKGLHDPATHIFTLAPAAPDDSRQRSVVLTAFEKLFLTGPGKGTETVTLDLSGVKAVIRLSEPEAEQVNGEASARADDGAYPSAYSSAYPPTEARILAAAKTWGTIHYLFAYRDLMDEDWDQIFAAALPKFIAAKDAREYNLTLCEMLTHLTDSHVAAASKALDDYFGEASVGLQLRMLDKHPVITSVLDATALEAGIKPGDIIKRIDGESIVDRFNAQVGYVPASTPQRSSFDTLRRILNGRVGSKVAIEVETPAGETKTVTLVRSHDFESAPQRDGEPVRLLSGNIAYLDLDRLTPEQAEAAMRQFHNAKAMLLDLRGRAPGASAVAAHLAPEPDKAAAIVTTPLALHPDVVSAGIATQTASTFLVQTLPAPALPLFKGRTVALVDERTIGVAEHAALLFEAANRTEFIGTPSAGADTETASFSVPGGLRVTYSARDIRHANGGKLQRLGLQPSASAPDSAKTIYEGKDEALEAALAYIAR